MAGNSIGQLFRVTTCGESHGVGLMAIIDGVPPGIELSEADLQRIWTVVSRVLQNLQHSVKSQMKLKLFPVCLRVKLPVLQLVFNPQYGPEIERLWQYRANFPPGSCRLYLYPEVWFS